MMLARVTEQYNAEQKVLHDLGVPDDLIITKEFVEKEILPNAKKELILRSYLSFFDMLAKAVEANVLDRELVIFIFGGRIRAVFDRWKAYIDAKGDNSYLEWRRLVEEVNRLYPK